jgi:predicted NAD-dependent protein-ADP-ribosyltransferase YbiA (DUF1768 family)
VIQPYPKSWWASLPPETKEIWEISPDHAGPGQVVLSKRNELGILSNFAATPFIFRGLAYGSVEGFWQMLKYPEGANDERWRSDLVWPMKREQVAGLSGREAKHAGDTASENMKKLGIDWVTFEGRKLNYRSPKKGEFYQLIYEVEWAKLQQNPEVELTLLKTGNLQLLPDHEVGDVPPAWKYFEIWMEIREIVRTL